MLLTNTVSISFNDKNLNSIQFQQFTALSTTRTLEKFTFFRKVISITSVSDPRNAREIGVDLCISNNHASRMQFRVPVYDEDREV
jgi:hypothetical protein